MEFKDIVIRRRMIRNFASQPIDPRIIWPVPYWFMDIGCAVMIALLAAIDEGLVSAFVGSKDLNALRSTLNMPAEVTPVGVIAIGYRAQDVPSSSLKRGRKTDAEYIHHETW